MGGTLGGRITHFGGSFVSKIEQLEGWEDLDELQNEIGADAGGVIRLEATKLSPTVQVWQRELEGDVLER